MTTNASIFDHLNRLKWSHLACVLAGVALATLLRFPFQTVIRDASPFLFYIPVVVVVAIIFGKRCGLYATMLSVLPANYFWMAPEHAFGLDLGGIVPDPGFFVCGLLRFLGERRGL